jgi:hypothetical protein
METSSWPPLSGARRYLAAVGFISSLQEAIRSDGGSGHASARQDGFDGPSQLRYSRRDGSKILPKQPEAGDGVFPS